ncbi:Nori-2 protein [Aphelenchoides avenae]|nr:Nori-2 protein [Aphelenchus avenae]
MEIDTRHAKEPRMDPTSSSTTPMDSVDGHDVPAVHNGFEYSKEETPFQQGAEARLYRCVFLGRKAVIKQRFVKEYRHPALDEVLTKERLKNELRGILKCKEVGIDAPSVYFISQQTNEIIFEYIAGELSARNYIENVLRRQSDDQETFNRLLSELGEKVGGVIGRFHAAHFTHGDLTTSNVMLRDQDPQKVVLIDFGLAQNTTKAEDKAVDLYVLERAIRSTHNAVDSFVGAIYRGYQTAMPTKQHGAVMSKLQEVRLRGRKRDMIG